MAKELELLRRALDAWDDNEPNDFNDCMEEIRAFLAAETEAEPGNGWHLREVYFEDGEPMMHREPPQPAELEAKPIGYVFQYSDGVLGSDIYYTPEEAVAYTEGDGIGIPVYRHPPKSVARPIGYADRHELEEFRSGNYGNFSVQCKEKCEDAVAVFIEPAARKPMTEEEIDAETVQLSWEAAEGFYLGVVFAEKHHGIGGSDER